MQARRLSDSKILFDITPEATEETTWTWLATTGTWSSDAYGEFEITLSDLEKGISNFTGTGRSTVLDFEHSFDDPNVAPHKRIASGEVLGLELRGEELWGEVKWTDSAKEKIKNGEFLHFSPTFTDSFTNKQTGEDQGWTLIGGALTNRPFIDNQPKVAAKEFHKEKKMPELTKLAEFLEVSEEEILETVTELKEKSANETKALAEVQAEVVTLKESNEALKVELSESNEKIAGFIAEKKEADFDALKLSAIEKGKAIPADFEDGSALVKLYEKDAELVKEMIDGRPEGYAVKLGEQGTTDENKTEPEKWEDAVELVKKESKKELSESDAIRIAAEAYPKLFSEGVEVD